MCVYIHTRQEGCLGWMGLRRQKNSRNPSEPPVWSKAGGPKEFQQLAPTMNPQIMPGKISSLLGWEGKGNDHFCPPHPHRSEEAELLSILSWSLTEDKILYSSMHRYAWCPKSNHSKFCPSASNLPLLPFWQEQTLISSSPRVPRTTWNICSTVYLDLQLSAFNLATETCVISPCVKRSSFCSSEMVKYILLLH